MEEEPVAISAHFQANDYVHLHVRNDLDHYRLARRRDESIARTSSEQTLVRRSQRLPDVCQDDKEPENNRYWSSAENVRNGNDKYICKSQCDDIDSGKERKLLLVEMEIGA